MKKTLLLATTAIVSAFAFNVKAEPISYSGDVILEASVELVYTVTSETVQELNFGRIAYVPGAIYKVGADGTTSDGDGYAQQFGTAKNGIVKITSQASATADPSEHLKLVLPSKIDMYKGGDKGAKCGEVTNLTQGTLTSSGGRSYDIPFGGTFTVATPMIDGSSSDGGPMFSCLGSATATLVYEP